MPFDPLALAAEAPEAASFEHLALDALDRALGFDAAFFAVLGATPTTRAVDPRRLERAFAEHTYDHELAPLKASAMARRGVVVDTAVFGARAVERKRYHRDFARPVGGRHTLMAYLAVRGRPLGAVMLGRSGSAFTDDEVRAIEGLLPSLALARASYALPWISEPLAPPRGALERAFAWAQGDRVLAERRGDGPPLVVRDRAGERQMVARSVDRESIWSRARLDAPSRSGWFYVDLFHLAASRARARRSALFIGSGGGVALRQFAEVYPGIALDVVESDPRVLELARDWFGLASIPGLSVHVDDGVAFVARAPAATWDVVVVDAFDADGIPPGMDAKAFFRDVARVLRPGGAVAFNAIGALSGRGTVRAIERAMRASIPDVRLVPVLDPGEAFDRSAIRNVVLVGARG